MAAECETTDATSNSSVGIVLVLLACCCYALGNCLQRYSLLRQDDEKVLYCLNRHAGWLLGAIIYFSANGIYAVALSFAPVSVLAAVFSLTIVANATCANLLLGDRVLRTALPGYIAVLAGSVVFSLTVQAEVCHFGGEELIQVMTSPLAFFYWACMAVIVLGGMVYAWKFEKAFSLVVKATEDAPTSFAVFDNENSEEVNEAKEPSSIELLTAGFIYPASLGATEAVGALILKAVNSLFTTLATDEDDPEEPANNHLSLWIGLLGVGVFIFAGIVTWLRLVYSRFEITAAFPVEFGMLTFASVVGGFMVFEDHQYVASAWAWVWVICASLLILGGIAIVGLASWKDKVNSVVP